MDIVCTRCKGRGEIIIRSGGKKRKTVERCDECQGTGFKEVVGPTQKVSYFEDDDHNIS